jgi:hypothetical protein
MMKHAIRIGILASILDQRDHSGLTVPQPVEVFFVHSDAVPNLVPQSYPNLPLRLLTGRTATQYGLPVDGYSIRQRRAGTFPFR